MLMETVRYGPDGGRVRVRAPHLGCGATVPARRAMADVEHARLLRRVVWRHQGRICPACCEPIRQEYRRSGNSGDAPTTDHVIPRSAGGSYWQGNVLCYHRRCNEAKADRMPTGCELIWLLAVNARMGVKPDRW